MRLLKPTVIQSVTSLVPVHNAMPQKLSFKKNNRRNKERLVDEWWEQLRTKIGPVVSNCQYTIRETREFREIS